MQHNCIHHRFYRANIYLLAVSHSRFLVAFLRGYLNVLRFLQPRLSVTLHDIFPLFLFMELH